MKKSISLKVSDLYILHLSDLHISGPLDSVFFALVKDFKVQVKNVRQLAIIVTGDIVQRNSFDEKSKQSIIRFFNLLKEAIPNKCIIKAVEFVPGNHDISRPTCKNAFHSWTYRPQAREYLDLIYEIRRVFFGKTCIRDNKTYGVIKIDYNGKSVCLLKVDTSWYKDYKSLRKECADDLALFGNKGGHYDLNAIIQSRVDEIEKATECQHKYLYSEYLRVLEESKSRNSDIVCTIAISHFPVTWLMGAANKKLQDFLYENGLPNIDMWLCGHAHNAQLYFNNDDSKSTLMLMTGVGRKLSLEVKQRYSLYQLSFERNVCAVKIRAIANQDESFSSDTSLYRGVSRRNYDFCCFPLKSKTPGTVYRMNSVEIKASKGIYFDEDVVSIFREVAQRIAVLYAKLQEESRKHLWIMVAKLCSCKRLKLNESQIVKAVLWDDYRDRDRYAGNANWRNVVTDIIIQNNIFRDLLLYILSDVQEMLALPKIAEVGIPQAETYTCNPSFKDNALIRVHFRKYLGAGKTRYEKGFDFYEACLKEDIIGNPPKLAPWSGQISEAFNHKDKLLVNSVSEVPNPIATKWSDFLTAVPDLPENVKLFGRPLPAISRPLLTYGVSVWFNSFEGGILSSRVLYACDFARLNHCVSSAINFFVEHANADLERIVEKL